MRKYLMAAAFALVAALAACGGGGGSGSPDPTPTPSPTPGPVVDTAPPVLALATTSPAQVTTTIVMTSNEDITRAEVTVEMRTGEGEATVPVPGTALIQSGNRSVVWTPSAALPHGKVFQVSAIAHDTAGNRGSVTGTVTTVGDGTRRYKDKVYELYTAAYPFFVTKTGPIQLVNKTGFAGIRPFQNCEGLEDNLPDGKVLFRCAHVSSGIRYELYTDPTETIPSLYMFTGTLPTNLEWKSVDPFDPAKKEWGPKARVVDGWFFTPINERWVNMFQPDNGSAFVTEEGTTLQQNGTVRWMRSYNN